MRVPNITTYAASAYRLGNLTSSLKDANETVSTQKRINEMSDDPVGLTQVMNLNASVKSLEQVETNVNMGKSWLSSVENSLDSVNNLILEAKTEATRLASDSSSADERKDAVERIKGLIDQIVSLGNTKINGNSIFGGTDTDTIPLEYDSKENPTRVSYKGNETSFEVKTSKDTAVSVGRAGSQTFWDDKVSINSTNNRIVFKEGNGHGSGVEKIMSVEIEQGEYTKEELETRVRNALNKASEDEGYGVVYDVEYDADSKRYAIRQSGESSDYVRTEFMWETGKDPYINKIATGGTIDSDDLNIEVVNRDSLTLGTPEPAGSEPFRLKWDGEDQWIVENNPGYIMPSKIDGTAESVDLDLTESGTPDISIRLDKAAQQDGDSIEFEIVPKTADRSIGHEIGFNNGNMVIDPAVSDEKAEFITDITITSGVNDSIDFREIAAPSIIESGARFDQDYTVAANTAVSGGTLVDGTTLASGSTIGSGTTLLAGTIISSGTVFTDDLETGLDVEEVSSGTIVSGSTLASGTILGSGTVLSSGTTMGSGSVLGSGTILVDDITLGQKVSGASSGTLISGSTLASGTILGAETQLLSGTSIGSGSVLGSGTVLVDDITTGETISGISDGTLRSGSHLTSGSVIGAGTILAGGSTIGSGTVLSADFIINSGINASHGGKLTAGTEVASGSILTSGTVLAAGEEMFVSGSSGSLTINGDGHSTLHDLASDKGLSSGQYTVIGGGDTLSDGILTLGSGSNLAWDVESGYIASGSSIEGAALTTTQDTSLEGDMTLKGSGIVLGGDITLEGETVIAEGSSLTSGSVLGEKQITLSNSMYTISGSLNLEGTTILKGSTSNNELDGNMTIMSGTSIAAGSTLVSGSSVNDKGITISDSSYTISGTLNLEGTTILKGSTSNNKLDGNMTIVSGTTIAAGSTLVAGSKLADQSVTIGKNLDLTSAMDVVGTGVVMGDDTTVKSGTVIAKGSQIERNSILNNHVPVDPNQTFAAGTVMAEDYGIINKIEVSSGTLASGTVFVSGSKIPSGATLSAGTVLGAGTELQSGFNVSFTDRTGMAVFSGGAVIGAGSALESGTVIGSGTTLTADVKLNQDITAAGSGKLTAGTFLSSGSELTSGTVLASGEQIVISSGNGGVLITGSSGKTLGELASGKGLSLSGPYTVVSGGDTLDNGITTLGAGSVLAFGTDSGVLSNGSVISGTAITIASGSTLSSDMNVVNGLSMGSGSFLASGTVPVSGFSYSGGDMTLMSDVTLTSGDMIAKGQGITLGKSMTNIQSGTKLLAGSILGRGSFVDARVNIGGQSAPLTATISAGNYTDMDALSQEIETQLEEASANDVDYAVTYDPEDSRFVIREDGATLDEIQILWETGPNSETNAASTLGFYPLDDTVSYPASETTIAAGTVLSADYTIKNDIAVSSGTLASGTVFSAGSTIPAGSELASGTVIGAGTVLTADFSVNQDITATGGGTLTSGTVIASGSTLTSGTVLASGEQIVISSGGASGVTVSGDGSASLKDLASGKGLSPSSFYTVVSGGDTLNNGILTLGSGSTLAFGTASGPLSSGSVINGSSFTTASVSTLSGAMTVQGRGVTLGADMTVKNGTTLFAGSLLAQGSSVNSDIDVGTTQCAITIDEKNCVLDFEEIDATIASGTVLSEDQTIVNNLSVSSGKLVAGTTFASGSTIPTGAELGSGTTIGAGTVLTGDFLVNRDVTATGGGQLASGTLIAAGSSLTSGTILASGEELVISNGASGVTVSGDGSASLKDLASGKGLSPSSLYTVLSGGDTLSHGILKLGSGSTLAFGTASGDLSSGSVIKGSSFTTASDVTLSGNMTVAGQGVTLGDDMTPIESGTTLLAGSTLTEGSAVNDEIVIQDGSSGNLKAVISRKTYTDISEFAKEIETAMEAASANSIDYKVTYDNSVESPQFTIETDPAFPGDLDRLTLFSDTGTDSIQDTLGFSSEKTGNTRYSSDEPPVLMRFGSDNNVIDFKETATDGTESEEKTIEIPEGNYTDLQDVASAIQSAMRSESPNEVEYNVTYDYAEGSFMIKGSSEEIASYSLLWESGENSDKSAASLLGFDASADDVVNFAESDEEVVNLTIDSSNNKIDFKEVLDDGTGAEASELTAQIEPRTYTSYSRLAREVEKAIETESLENGNNIDYSVSWDDYTNKFTIKENGNRLNEFQLNWHTGENSPQLGGTGESIGNIMGFHADADDIERPLKSNRDVEWGVFNTLFDLNGYLEANDADGIERTIGRLEANFDNMTSRISNTGIRYSRLELRENMTKEINLKLTERRSMIEDADIVDAIMKLKNIETAYKASLSSTSSVLNISLVDYM